MAWLQSVTLLAFCTVALAKDPKPDRIRIAEVGHFTATFPDSSARASKAPVYLVQGNRMQFVTHTCEFDGLSYSVMYTYALDVRTKTMLADAKPEILLDGACAALHAVGVEFKKEMNFTEAGVPGREIVLETGSNAVHAKFDVREGRLYQVLVAGPKDRIAAAEPALFFKNFEMAK